MVLQQRATCSSCDLYRLLCDSTVPLASSAYAVLRDPCMPNDWRRATI